VAQRVSVETRDTEQAHLCLALPGLSLRHPQRFSFDLLNAILGEGMGSRLFSEIRDRLCLAYSINSYTDHFLDSGSLIVAAGVNPQNLTTAVKAIVEQLSLLRENIPEDELTKAKEMSKGRLMLRLEDSRSMAGWLGGQETMLGKILTVDDILGIIEVITTEDLKELARGLIRDSEFRLAVVGPGIKPEPLEDLLKI
jgi:predicted Zn-dependent peptidase